MIVRLTAVVLRLSALYFLWQTFGFLGTFQFVLASDEEGPYLGLIITIFVLLLVTCALWFFAARLAPHFYPYEDQSSVSVNLDVDRLESVIVQIIGLILILLGLHDILLALLNAMVAIVDHGYDLDESAAFLSVSRGLLFTVLGLILLVRFKGLLAWLKRLRAAGTS